ncbi:hypothetical protein Pst134EB_010229 [Puccinia striiformis f. sp. tritici]|nr:hypothetical protein Pst134EB_010229 [Puccinia striiformis f. sp. tritici]
MLNMVKPDAGVQQREETRKLGCGDDVEEGAVILCVNCVQVGDTFILGDCWVLSPGACDPSVIAHYFGLLVTLFGLPHWTNPQPLSVLPGPSQDKQTSALARRVSRCSLSL